MSIRTTLAILAVGAVTAGSAAVVIPPIKTSHAQHSTAASWSSKHPRKV